jgi:hypothetical protein
MSTSYRAVLVLLEESRRGLRAVSVPRRADETLAWLRQLRLTEIKAADAACEAFAANGEWPPIRTDVVVAQVQLRLTSAISLCRSHDGQPLAASLTQRELLRRLLLDYWHGKVARLLQTHQEMLQRGGKAATRRDDPAPGAKKN